MQDTLKLALIHCPVEHGSLGKNRDLLLRLNQKAASRGAQIILNTEMGLSGYGFDSRAEIKPLTQLIDGEAVGDFAKLASKHQVYVALGLAELEPRNGAYFNSAILLGPDGGLQAHRRKITAESKWACPGPARQSDTARTPWGKVGLLICSETYFSLLPRTMALKGVDLLLVPANWPPGGIDPRHLWRNRALENGVYLAACNRAGIDKTLDMTEARSCLFDPWGQDRLAATPVEEGIFLAELPLRDRRLASAGERRHRLSDRKPGCYHYIYSQLNRIQNLTTYLDLPEPGTVEVHVLGLEAVAAPPGQELWGRLESLAPAAHRLAVLPAVRADRIPPDWLAQAAESLGLNIVCQIRQNGMPNSITVFRPGKAPQWWTLPAQGAAEPPYVDIGPARVGLAPAVDLLHPELALAMAKRGCDLVACSGGLLGEEQRAVLGMRSLERVVLALAYRGGGLICSPPEGHQPGQRLEAAGAQTRHLSLDTSQTRSKVYEERLDFEVLLDPGSAEAA